MGVNKYTIAAIFQCCGAAMLLGLGIRFLWTNEYKSVPNVIICVYYICFAILMIFSEIGFNLIINGFYFLQFLLGKAIFALFISIITFGWKKWENLTVCIYFFVVCFVFLILMCVSEPQKSAPKNGDNTKIVKEDEKVPLYGTAHGQPANPSDVNVAVDQKK